MKVLIFKFRVLNQFKIMIFKNELELLGSNL